MARPWVLNVSVILWIYGASMGVECICHSMDLWRVHGCLMYLSFYGFMARPWVLNVSVILWIYGASMGVECICHSMDLWRVHGC